MTIGELKKYLHPFTMVEIWDEFATWMYDYRVEDIPEEDFEEEVLDFYPHLRIKNSTEGIAQIVLIIRVKDKDGKEVEE